MSYYYTVQEYASKQGLSLSVQEEARAGEAATTLSNERGIRINKVPGRSQQISCYPMRILREAFSSMRKEQNLR
ncbi:MAG: hypothetical protein LPK07_00060 [Hymenobacteraceae bacterium]|nr:hypothetical protein [Hymenobacteraceae bacterium]MDX5480056.1 hypothetical protein [Hymenobacteraceae bacterium]